MLEVTARWDGPAGIVFETDGGCGRFLRAVEVRTPAGWIPAEQRGDVVFAEPCATGACELRWRFDLGGAAAALRRRETAFEHEGALMAPPSTFLLRPPRPRPGRFRLRFHASGELSFVTGLPADGDGWVARWDDLPQAPWSGFGRFDRDRVAVDGGVVDIAVGPGRQPPAMADLREWVTRAARAQASIHGRLPVQRVQLILLPGRGRRGVGFGTALGSGGASIMVWLGAGTDATDLRRDWVLAHEMMHLGFPNVDRRHLWLEEGLATYLEEIGRARAGLTDPREAWSSLVRGMPNGLPRDGDGGLDGPNRWGRLYWGGALFALVADVRIRDETRGRFGLDDALRAIAAKGGTAAERWPLSRALGVADAATGTTVLSAMYATWSRDPVAVDLDALWGRLGVARAADGSVQLVEAAPLAAVRRAIVGQR